MVDAIKDSILDGTKKALGLEPDYDAFDSDIVMHINTTFFTLSQLGVGPENGYSIEDNTTLWTHFLGTNKNLNAVKTYIYLRVRLLFDPPATSFAIEAVTKQIQELEWRLNIEAEKGAFNAEEHLWNMTNKDDFPVSAAVGDLGVDLESGNVWRKTLE